MAWVAVGTAAVGAVGSYLSADQQRKAAGNLPQPGQLPGPSPYGGISTQSGGMYVDPVTGLTSQVGYNFNPQNMQSQWDAQSMYNQFMGRGAGGDTSAMDWEMKRLEQEIARLSQPGKTGTAAIPAEFRGIQPFIDKEKGGLWSGLSDPQGIQEGKYGEQGQQILDEYNRSGSGYPGGFQNWLKDHQKNNDIPGKIAAFEKTQSVSSGNDEIKTKALQDLQNQLGFLTQQKQQITGGTQASLNDNPLMKYNNNTPVWQGGDTTNPYRASWEETMAKQQAGANATPQQIQQQFGLQGLGAMEGMGSVGGVYNQFGIDPQALGQMGVAGTAGQYGVNPGDFNRQQSYIDQLGGYQSVNAPTVGQNAGLMARQDALNNQFNAGGNDPFSIASRYGLDNSQIGNQTNAFGQMMQGYLSGSQNYDRTVAPDMADSAAIAKAQAANKLRMETATPTEILNEYGVKNDGAEAQRSALSSGLNDLSGSGPGRFQSLAAGKLSDGGAGAMNKALDFRSTQNFANQNNARDAQQARRGFNSSSVNEIARAKDSLNLGAQLNENALNAANYSNDIATKNFGMDASAASSNNQMASAQNSDALGRAGMKLNYASQLGGLDSQSLAQAQFARGVKNDLYGQGMGALGQANQTVGQDFGQVSSANQANNAQNLSRLGLGINTYGTLANNAMGVDQARWSSQLGQAGFAQGAQNQDYSQAMGLAGYGDANAQNQFGMNLQAAGANNQQSLARGQAQLGGYSDLNNSQFGQNLQGANFTTNLQNQVFNQNQARANYGLNAAQFAGNAQNQAFGRDQARSQNSTAQGQFAQTVQQQLFGNAMNALQANNSMRTDELGRQTQNYQNATAENNTGYTRNMNMYNLLNQQQQQAFGNQNTQQQMALQGTQALMPLQMNQQTNQTNANMANAQMQNSWQMANAQNQASANNAMWGAIGNGIGSIANAYGTQWANNQQPQNATLRSVQNGTFRAQPVTVPYNRPNPATDPYATFGS